MRLVTIRISVLTLTSFLLISALGICANYLTEGTRQTTAYHSWDELVAEMNQIATDHKTITKLVSIGKTWEGRDILAMKISDNSELDEEEPAVMYNGMHHAREWLSLEVPLYIINYLTDNYTTNLTIKNLVDSTEIWVIPCVNPDGRAHDGTDDPSTAKSWRKNRFPNGDGSFGVDPNRNYGYMWGALEGEGSSSRPSAQDYRGANPFSELEIQAIRDLALKEKFVFSIAYHSYSELILYPWGYTSSTVPEPDLTVFKTVGAKMRDLIPNNAGGGTKYTLEQSSDLYLTDGGDHDWLYAALGTFAYAIELYPSGLTGTFYPDPAIIPVVCQDNIEAALYLAKIASNPYQVLPYHVTLNCNNSYKQANPAQKVTFNISVWNSGYSNDTYTFSSSTISDWAIAPNITSLTLNSDARAQITLNVTPNSTATSGEHKINFKATSQSNTSINDTLELIVEISYNNDVGADNISPFTEGNEYSLGRYSIEGRVKNYGMQTQNIFNVSLGVYKVNPDYEINVFSDDFEYTGNGDWTLSPASNVWNKGAPTAGITFAHSGTQVWATNLNGQYGYNENDWLLSPNIILPSNATAINLTFWHFTLMDAGYDNCWVKLKVNTSWTRIACFSMEMNVTEWRKVSLNLTEFKGSTVQLGFQLTSDNIINDYGWYIDDITITAKIPSETEIYNSTKLTTQLLSQYSTEVLTWYYEFTEAGRYRIKLKTLLDSDEKVSNNEKSVTITILEGFIFYLTQGWNFIALPYTNASIVNASDLANAIGENCSYIANWTGTGLVTYTKNVPASDFTLQYGRGYLVYVANATANFLVVGTRPPSASINLNKGWSNIGLLNSSLSKASELANAIGDCSAVAYWDNSLNRFVMYTGAVGDFELEVGKGYLVFMEVAKTWAQTI